MKLTITALFFLYCIAGYSQWNPNPTNSRFYNSKFSTFPLRSGDIYIYEMEADTSKARLIVTIEGCCDTLVSTWSCTSGNAGKDTSYLTSRKAMPSFSAPRDSQNDTTRHYRLWMSQQQMAELILLKETIMDLGNGPEVFFKRKNSIIKIKQGRSEKILTVFTVENSGAKGKISFKVLNDQRNPAILQVDSPIRLLLKEVR